MIRMYINNEEVVCDKNIEIKEEFLSTSSTILKNVYPKSWESTKDYVSNFYFPPDYSKCLIYNSEYVPPVVGSTVEGSSLNIDYDSTLQNEITKVYGNTFQQTYTGKNLLNTNNIIVPTMTGLTTTLEDAKLTLNGTSSAGYIISNNSNTGVTLQPGNYTISVRILSGTTNIGSTNYNAVAYIKNYTTNTAISGAISIKNAYNNTNKVASGQITISETTQIGFEIYTNGSAEYDNLVVGIQLESGSLTNWETYVGGIPSPNPDYPQDIQTITGENTIKIIGKNLFDGEMAQGDFDGDGNVRPSTTSKKYSTNYIRVNPSGEYVSNKQLNRVCFYDINKNFISRSSNYNFYRITIPNNAYYIRFDISSDIATNEIQIEQGTTPTTYEPYKSQTYTIDLGSMELCKIGTYQDYIYKENNKWYKYSAIGKVVLDGSENWSDRSNYNYADRFVANILTANSNVHNCYSNYFGYQDLTNTYPYIAANTTQCVVNFSAKGTTTLAQFKTWLSTHNTIVYYVLATPTTTEITDSELIEQFENLPLYNGVNNIQFGTDLSFVADLYYNYNEAHYDNDLLFCGVVKNTGNIDLNPRKPHFCDLQVLDFKTFLSEGETLDFVIYEKTVEEAIEQVVSEIRDYGFIIGNINIIGKDDIIGAYSTKDKTAYDIFNYLADITQSRWYTRLIDENTVAIDFYDPSLMTEGTEIDYTTDFFENYLIDDITYSYNTQDYRNKQVMVSNQILSNISQTQTIVANGYQTQFNTEQPIGKINSITSNGISLTYATYQEKEMGISADFYYTPGENYFESDDLRSTGEVLIIDYVAVIEGRQVITNAVEIDRIQESTGRKGIVARYENRNDATTSDELQKIGQSYIKYKGVPEIVLKVVSRSNIWNIGEKVKFNAPLDNLDTYYMVRSKRINYIATIETIFYTYELISSFNSERDINYFDNQRAKAKGNIGEGEYISRNIDIESSANIIFYDAEYEEISVIGNNILDSTLDSPFTS